MPDNTLEIPAQPDKVRAMMADPQFQTFMKLAPDRARAMLDAARTGQSLPPMSTSAPSRASMPGTFNMRKPPSAAEMQQIAQIRATVNELQSLRNTMKGIGPDRWNRSGSTSRTIGGVETAGAPTRWWQVEGRKLGMSSPSDEEVNRAIGKLITLQGQTEAALMKSAGSRNYQFVKDVKGHLPMPAGDYQTNMENFDYLLSPSGPYQQMLTQMGAPGNAPGGDDSSAAPAAKSSASSGDAATDALRKHGLLP